MEMAVIISYFYSITMLLKLCNVRKLGLEKKILGKIFCNVPKTKRAANGEKKFTHVILWSG